MHFYGGYDFIYTGRYLLRIIMKKVIIPVQKEQARALINVQASIPYLVQINEDQYLQLQNENSALKLKIIELEAIIDKGKNNDL